MRDVTRDDLIRQLGGEVVSPGASTVDIAVAESLLGVTFPPGLLRLLRLSNGLRLGATVVHDLDEITARSQEPDVLFQLPDHLVIGVAGTGRSLVMHVNNDTVLDVPDSPWDGGDMHQSAMEPLDLFLRYGGVPLREREPYSSLPGATNARDHALRAGRAAASEITHTDVTRNVGALTGDSCLGQVAVYGIADREAARVQYEHSEDVFLRLCPPPCPVAGGEEDYVTLWNEIADQLRPDVDGAAAGKDLPDFTDVDGLSITAGTVRTVLFGYTAEMFARGLSPDVPTPVTSMLAVLRAGHLPIGVDCAGRVLVY